MANILFKSEKHEASFHSPLQDMQLVNQSLEVRFDPLTGHQSVFNSALEDKAKLSFPDTDFDYLEQRAEETEQSCFLCPPDWRKNTPRYPEVFLSSGRLEKGQATLFPNLFPVAAYHGMIRLGDKHLRKLNDLPAWLLDDGFSAALDFVRRCHEYDPKMRFATINANYQLPAGASLIHPHFQVLNSPEPSTHHQLLLQKCAEYQTQNTSNYWQDLVEEEKAIGRRWIGQINESQWITAFSPMGFNEIQIVWPERQSFLDWSDKDVQDLALGLNHILGVWHDMNLSSFNFSCFSAPLGRDSPHFCCVMRIVNRQNVFPHHRTDDYFLQKLMRNELILNRPEKLAQWMRKDFPES
jgi:galactose-1-phosphate uridylyltransferase